MAVRTTELAVQGIIDVEPSISLTPFIEVANLLVTKICATADSLYDHTQLEMIERWLSAHFYAQRDVRRTQERAGSVSEAYESVIDLGLDNTRYGQMAKQIDTEGYLAANEIKVKAGGSVSVTAEWLGLEPEEVLDEEG